MNLRKTAFSPVINADGGFNIAIVEEHIAGYALLPGAPTFVSWDAAMEAARHGNEIAGTSVIETLRIIATSIAASNAAGKPWEPRGA